MDLAKPLFLAIFSSTLFLACSSGSVAGPDAGTPDAAGVECKENNDCDSDLCVWGVCETAAACDEVVLSWAAPVEREDGVCLEAGELSHFMLYHGRNQEDYQQDLNLGYPCSLGPMVPCGSDGESRPEPQCSARITLEAVTWYMVMTSVDTDDRESLYGPEMIFDLSCP